jgi:hypothetical protein
MWKLGFRIQNFALENKRFGSSLQSFSAAVKEANARQGMAAIRSAAVNFFIDLEDVLKRSLSFSVWLLLSDHYGETRFKFNPKSTQGIIYRTFSTGQTTSADLVEFDPAGHDTLYPLIRGFKLLADTCEGYILDDDMHLRPADKQPGFARKSELDLFPFKHTALVNDISRPQQRRLLSLLTEVTSSFEAAQVANLRNRLEHDRPTEELPTKEESSLVISTVEDVVEKLEQSGLLPLTYNIISRQTDRWQRPQTTLVNYRGNHVVVSARSELGASKLCKLEDHTIIVPWVRIAGTPEILRFSLEEDSDYVGIWPGSSASTSAWLPPLALPSSRPPLRWR